jgi:uncharacterized protein YcbX
VARHRLTHLFHLLAAVTPDGFPVLLAAAESITDLNSRMAPGGGPADMARFRPNIVLSGSGPWADDAMGSVRLGGGEGGAGGGGGVEVALVKPCSRCTVPLVDQSTGEVNRNKEPIATLQKYRCGAVTAVCWGGDRHSARIYSWRLAG